MKKNHSQTDLFANGIEAWGQRVREGQINFEHTVSQCLELIKQSEKLNAFECLDSNRALATAAALDGLLNQGIDLGPLMGLPIGVKDIMAAEGLPTTNGSNADTSALSGSEGQVVKRLKRSGAVVMGKTRTVEFALGATGVNESRGTPWNPVDRDTHRIPGGSSSGSAVATSAALIGLGLGTDTGGSIRIPACFTGIVGHKTSVGQWPCDGVFSLSHTLDSIGPLCRTVNDAALMHQLITGEQVPTRDSIKGLRLGIVEDLFMDDLDTKVATDFEHTCQLLERAGAHIVRLKFPEVHERTPLFTAIVPAELISFLTPERFSSIQDGVDTVTASRAAVGLNVSAHAYVSALRRREALISKANLTFEQVDVWISPTCPFVPMALADLNTDEGHRRALLASRNTQPGNLLDMCGVSLPMHKEGLPTGLQITMPLNQDANLLAIGAAVEACLSI
jgi:aspartyl-tRNA(Asn)/glutamyl-tRNA(Gln) amidotransferase subunit A